MNYKLTVALITMNRADQLKLAIESCFSSVMPEKTQFVIVDNGSTDNTEDVVNELKAVSKYDIVYRKEPVNLGVGGGRNVCFDLAEGEYIYFFDDDAEIANECYSTFFTESIAYLDRNPSVAILTTEIRDKVFVERKTLYAKNAMVDGHHCVITFHGGTSFVRRSCFESPMFMNIMYGNEEIAVAMGALDRGYSIVWMPEIFIDHNPKVDKWHSDVMVKLTMQGISNMYAIKKMLYPSICKPILYLAYKKRIKNSGITDKTMINGFKKMRKDLKAKHKLKKIKLSTIINSYREFGLTVF